VIGSGVASIVAKLLFSPVMGLSPFKSVNRQELYTKYECISYSNHDATRA
jgi:hypothetical protein